jgi:malonyl-CoA/methylmalonyl-CoA synthetase
MFTFSFLFHFLLLLLVSFFISLAVPLSTIHPPELLEYYIDNSQANLILTTPEYVDRIKPLADKLKKPLQIVEHQKLMSADKNSNSFDEDALMASFPSGNFYKKSPALIMYTSGTTSKPKGVVLSHSNISAQIESLTNAWKISNTDVVLHSLPLFHVHGVINALLLPLSAGAKIIMLPKFDSDNVWTYLLNVNMPQKDRVTVFMGVPTTYHYLISEYDKLFSKSTQMTEYIKTHCQNKIRLMISGSAPLPNTIFQRWKEITGHKLLERYGMTEIGMCLSNTLNEDKIKQRLPGFVGQPLPGVNIRIVNADNSDDILLEAKGDYNKGLWSQQQDEKSTTLKIKAGIEKDNEIIGSLHVKGDGVFKEYYNKPDSTKDAFTKDGWFITGDTACYDPTVNSFKIMGRNAVDIIKSRGYKLSALEIETKLLENSAISDCAVVGLPDSVLGQKIYALVVIRENAATEENVDIANLLEKWCENKFAPYSMPTIHIVNRIPRNQMGKVNKVVLVEDFAKLIAQKTAE